MSFVDFQGVWLAYNDELLAAKKFNAILVTHDLRESVFLADTVYVMSRSPCRLLHQRRTVSEMTAANEGIGCLLISAGASMQMGLAFAGRVTVGAMAMLMYELFAVLERRLTGWAHRGES